jgi:hypothetical protein
MHSLSQEAMMLSRRRLVRYAWLALPVMLAPAACASGGAAGPARDPNVIELREIMRYRDAGTRDLQELIQRARPRWLQTRGGRSINLPTNILVYQHEQMLGTTEILKDITTVNLVRVRYLDASRAGLLPGLGSRHVEAAIVIETTES